MGIVAGDNETPRHVCLECGFSDKRGIEDGTNRNLGLASGSTDGLERSLLHPVGLVVSILRLFTALWGYQAGKRGSV